MHRLEYCKSNIEESRQVREFSGAHMCVLAQAHDIGIVD